MPEHRIKWMLKRGLRTLEDLYQAVHIVATEKGWTQGTKRQGPRSEFSRNKVIAVMKDEDAAFAGGPEYSKLAIAIGLALRVHPLQLFGPVPINIRWQNSPKEKVSDRASANRLYKKFEYVSLDESDPEHRTALEQFADTLDLIDAAAMDELSHMLTKQMLRLPPRQEFTLRSRYHDDLTLEEVGVKLDVSRVRLAQIQAKSERILNKELQRSMEIKKAPIGILSPLERCLYKTKYKGWHSIRHELYRFGIDNFSWENFSEQGIKILDMTPQDIQAMRKRIDQKLKNHTSVSTRKVIVPKIDLA